MTKRAVVIDYGSGNLRSAHKALERAAAEAGMDVAVSVTADSDALAGAAHIVLPGVGAFADCMAGLAALDGMVPALEEAVLGRGTPFLGICVGMQLLAERGLEHGVQAGLGWIPGEVARLEPGEASAKIPHMGWNELEIPPAPHPVLAGIDKGAHVYFVHSFGFRCARPEHELARADYFGPVAAVVGRDNIVGTQFHPEKSQAVGLAILRNFLSWRP